jgi:amino-acid N-acetyltransferase
MVPIDFATPEDWDSLAKLLRECGLPVEGLVEHLGSTLVVREHGRVVASAALELYEPDALLRSVAVERSRRGRGLGQHLVGRVLDLARGRGVAAVYLLTLTAADFFAKQGFERISREEVPAGVQQSLEFRALCPASAIAMRRKMTP